jgi:hypothetical protein
MLNSFQQFILSGCTGSFIVRNEADGAVKFSMSIKGNNKMKEKKKAKSPSRLRRDAKRKALLLSSRMAVAEKQVSPLPSLSPVSTTDQATAVIGSLGGIHTGLETTEMDDRDSKETGSNQSSTDSDLDSIGPEEYQQFGVKDGDLMMCRNLAVKLYSHKGCIIPIERVESIKACNRNPTGSGVAFSNHACSKCIDNPPLVKTSKDKWGHTTYLVHESVEKFKVCPDCTKHKTTKICAMYDKGKCVQRDLEKEYKAK